MPISRTALATAPVAVVGSLALAVGTASGAQAAESHEVQPGETVTSIAARNGVSAADVMRWNELSYADARAIRPGQTLRLEAREKPAKGADEKKAEKKAKSHASTPASSGGGSHKVASGETLWSIASEHGVALGDLLRANGLKASAVIFPGQKLTLPGGDAPSPEPAADRTSAPAAPSGSHTVSSGETLWAIANEHGVTVASILAANDLERGAIIYPGQKLVIDGGASAPEKKHEKKSEKKSDENPQRSAALDTEQAENARLIIRVGHSVGANDRAIAEALATAMVESSLRNVEHGDRDSLGLFQQRTSKGWGTRTEVMDRTRAAKAFFGGASDPNGYRTLGLFDVAGWADRPFGEPAQIVQFSGHPDRYAQWETQAYRWLSELG